MRAKGQVGQIICTCGRVGELRTRANGKFLPFLMCKHCGMKQGKDGLREQWLLDEKPNNSLGKYGDFPESSSEHQTTSNETSKNKVSSEVVTSSEHQKEWVPDEDNPPENVDVEVAEKPEPTETTSKSGLSLGAKVGLSLLGVVGLAFGIKNLKLPS
ncbi:MAG: hypothetical protein OCD00_03040 [Colwellia sp.]